MQIERVSSRPAGSPVLLRGMRRRGTAGRCRGRLFSVKTGCCGFTLIELIAVIAILAGLMALVMPRFSTFGAALLKSDAGRLSTLIRYTSDAAATRKVYLRMSFDLEGHEVTVEQSGDSEEYQKVADAAMRGLRLTRGVEIKDIVTEAAGRVDYGTVRVVFAPTGANSPFTVHLASSGGAGDARTITYNPFSNRVKVAEGYL